MGFDAEYSYVPKSVTTKAEFYDHVLSNLKALLGEDGEFQQNWLSTVTNALQREVSTLSSVSSVLYNSFSDYHQSFGQKNRVNWAGFYVIPSIYPGEPSRAHDDPSELMVGPYHGRPGCLRIPLKNKRRGVCADAFLNRKSVVVQDVHQVPGHIACDGTTESEIVIPLLVELAEGKKVPVGVLDIDCQSANAWTQEDVDGLEKLVHWLVHDGRIVDWCL